MVSAHEDPIASLGVLAEPTRRRLYEYVVAQSVPVSRDAAAAALALGRPITSFHLDRLAAAGLLDVEYRRLTGRTGPGAGRPAKLYRRARAAVHVSLPERHYETAAAILATALEGHERHEAAGQEPGAGELVPTEPTDGQAVAGANPEVLRAARAYGRELAASAEEPTAGPRRSLLAFLGSAGFEPEEDPAAVTIRLRNCPFDDLAREHRGITCSMNLALLQGATEVIEGSGMEPVMAPEPGFCCVQFRAQTATGRPV